MTAYNPAANFEIKIWEEEFRKIPSRTLMARIYQPQGAGPFPVLLDLHGGAWNDKDRFANEPMDVAVAKSGVLVVAIDLTLGGEAPYPASVQDANLGVRWLKSKAPQWKGDPATLGILGSSSGGHVAQLLGMRQNHPLYSKLPLAGHPEIDSSVRYVATRSPISDPMARYQNAENRGRSEMMRKSKTYFTPWETINEANPQKILERKEKATLVPMLVMQGGLDDNVLPAIQEKFAAAYKAAGGDIEFHVYEGCGHIWIENPGPQTDRAHEMVKGFIARNLKAQKLVAA
jgi:acetyl esterase/lipase